MVFKRSLNYNLIIQTKYILQNLFDGISSVNRLQLLIFNLPRKHANDLTTQFLFKTHSFKKTSINVTKTINPISKNPSSFLHTITQLPFKPTLSSRPYTAFPPSGCKILRSRWFIHEKDISFMNPSRAWVDRMSVRFRGVERETEKTVN